MASSVKVRDFSFLEIAQSIRNSHDLDVLVQRVFNLVLKTIVTFHDLLIVPVHFYVRPASAYSKIAEELLKTCTPERVKRGQFCIEDLTDFFKVQQNFFQDIVKNFIEKVEGEGSKNFREKIWESVKPQKFVETYLTANPNNFTIFRDVVLKSYV